MNKILEKNNKTLAEQAMPILDNNNDIYNINNNINNNDNDIIIVNNIASKIDIENNSDSNDVFDAILSKKKGKNDKVFIGVYLDSDIADILEKLHKKHGKGIKSEFINEALRKVFLEKGLIKIKE